MDAFPSLKSPAIIALKGLPLTCKSEIANVIATQSKTPVLFIEDFLTLEAAPQSKEEAQRLLHRAFNVLCKVAEGQPKRIEVKYVVIKSRLCSTFEFDRLIELMIKSKFHALLIIECQFNDEYWRRKYLDRRIHDRWYDPINWYNPIAWNDVETASDDYNAQAWDDHFRYSIDQLSENKQHLVRRLIIDVLSDKDSIWGGGGQNRSNTPFFDVIRYLLKEEAMVQLPNTVEFDEVRRSILERELNTPRKRSEYLCRGERGCVFKYREALEFDSCCGVCEKPVSGSVYACYYCVLVLHKSCAEEPEMDDISNPTPYWDYGEKYDNLPEDQYYHFDEEHACDFCKELSRSFSYNCKSCLFQTHLKCRVMPTIVNHACHSKHFLSIWMKPPNPIVEGLFYPQCKGCYAHAEGMLVPCWFNGYVCVICNYNYHIRCIATPGEVKHKHGGYEHVMKLLYSYDGMEEEESFWCDVCNNDMNPDEWFYRCKECPYYITHMSINSRMPCKSRM